MKTKVNNNMFDYGMLLNGIRDKVVGAVVSDLGTQNTNHDTFWLYIDYSINRMRCY